MSKAGVESRALRHARAGGRMTAAVLGLLLIGVPARGQLYGPYTPNPIWGGGYPGTVAGWPQVNFGTYHGWADPYVGWATPYVGWTPWYSNPLADYQAAAAYDAQLASNYALAQGGYNLSSMQASTYSDASSLVGNDVKSIYYANHPEMLANHGERFNIRTTRAWSAGKVSGTRLVDLTSREGDVLWPLSAPTDGDLVEKRKAASEAIKRAIVEFRGGGGRVSIDAVSSALRALVAYADPAVEQLRKSNPGEVHGFIDFTRSLDRGLRLLVGKDLTEIPRPKSVTSPGVSAKP